MKRTADNYMVIIDFDQNNLRRPVVLMTGDEMEEVATFKTLKEIENIKRTHLMKDFEWYAHEWRTGACYPV